MNPFISICIPAYKRVGYLKRLLESIAVQTYRDFELIISDDSNDNSVYDLVQSFSGQLPIQYFRNNPSLGTPANWNFAVSKARGQWIKLIHDDDWFAGENALSEFAACAGKSQSKFIFSAYANCYESSGNSEVVKMPVSWKRRILEYPGTLLARNVVGPPSVTLVHRSVTETYDERMKWRVDLDFYIRLLMTGRSFDYISQSLINVGINDTQVTNACINVPSVEIPEGYLLLTKYGPGALKNIRVYDAWWRLLRNMRITRAEQLSQFGQDGWPAVILLMVRHLSGCPRFLLKNGVLSKLAMFSSWCINKLRSNI